MSAILLFFVFPIATIIFSIALEKLFNNPILVAAIIFAVFLIVTFVALTTDFLIFVIAYTLIALLTAYLTNVITNLIERLNNSSSSSNSSSNDDFNLNTQACRTCQCQKQLIRNLRGL